MSVSYTSNNDQEIRDYRGKSTDEKPARCVPNGSTFYEMDTGKLYMFDVDTGTWLEQ